MSERVFALLQGPPGPLFHRLAGVLRERRVPTYRINLNLGDRLDFPGEATDYRGRFTDWPVFFDNFLRRRRITDILLFGDCRPYHVVARRIAALRGIRTHVLEEGYLRPHWMTLELEGVNAHSRLRRDKSWFYAEAERLPAEPELPPITASFRRRVRDAIVYYTAVQFSRLLYPFYRSHRQVSPAVEAIGWIWRYLTRGSRERQAAKSIALLAGKRFFLFPLQLSGDFQIRSHSPFPNMKAATSYVLESFAAHAGSNDHLLVKTHPLDSSFFPWRLFLGWRARRLGIAGRVRYADGGDLDGLSDRTAGMICVNSTSATLALRAGTPVCVLGDAIYKVPGLVFTGHLDDFWAAPTPPEPGLYQAFRRVLLNECLIRGGLASESAVSTLLQTMADKLTGVTSSSEASQRSTRAKCPVQSGAR